jgi:hypothetical protein
MGSIQSEAKKSITDDESKLSDDAVNNKPADADVIDDSEFAETAVIEAHMQPTDNVGEGSVEIDVESLIADVEAEASEGVDASGRIRRKLDAVLERKRRHEEMVDFDDYDTEA